MYLARNAVHLTYCTNIHPSNGFASVLQSLEDYALPLKARHAPDQPFGIGLRLSGAESRELLEGGLLEEFKGFLEGNGLYVFTINGFPHGPFHRQRVKEEVHAPDWQSEERLAYTLRLATILAALLPDGMDGGISTSPLSYKAWVDAGDPALWEQLTEQMVRVAEVLVRTHRQQGKLIHLDIEPEPDGLLENSTELVRFFDNWLLGKGAARLAERIGVSKQEAEGLLLEHIRVCFDTCHVAVAYESPREVLARLAAHGIRVGKVQLSSALNVALGDEREAVREALSPFAESTYLHQVIQRNQDGSLTQYPDLPVALPHLDDAAAQSWRVHFHVPIFVERYGTLGSTQREIVETLELVQSSPITNHLEVETYTWEVLPEGLQQDLLSSIDRELGWVRDVL